MLMDRIGSAGMDWEQSDLWAMQHAPRDIVMCRNRRSDPSPMEQSRPLGTSGEFGAAAPRSH